MTEVINKTRIIQEDRAYSNIKLNLFLKDLECYMDIKIIDTRTYLVIYEEEVENI